VASRLTASGNPSDVDTEGTPSEQRYAFGERVLSEPPRFEPGTRREHSNASGIAGVMAERIGDRRIPNFRSNSWFSLGQI
jgi:hypothetical protein